MSFNLWLTFVAASSALLLIPGPTILLVLSYAVSQGRRVALASAAGVALGDFIAMTASLAGLGALVLTSATLFTVLKWIGAIYLMWLGLRLLRNASSPTSGMTSMPDTTARSVFRHTATVTALNPKSIAFFVAFVPQFVSPSAPLMPQFTILVATFVGLAALNVLAYALAAERLRRTISRPGTNTVLARTGGVTLIAMGLLTASMRRTA